MISFVLSSAHADENDLNLGAGKVLKYTMREAPMFQTEAAEEYKLKQEVEDLLQKVAVLEKQ